MQDVPNSELFTDDCGLIEAYGKLVKIVDGDNTNIKITTPEDLIIAEAIINKEKKMNYRIGHGYDVHKLQKGRELILGGVHIENGGIGLLGHSDADVLAHAVSDALLGAAALGDIGKHFPDTDDAYKNADSMVLYLKCVICLIRTVILSEI